MTTTKPTRAPFTVGPRPSRSHFNMRNDRGRAAYEAAKARHADEENTLAYLERFATITDDQIAAMPAEEQARTRYWVNFVRDLAASDEEFFRQREARLNDPALRAQAAGFWKRYYADLKSPKRQASKTYRSKYKATRPHKVALDNARRNLERTSASLVKYQGHLARVEAAKIALTDRTGMDVEEEIRLRNMVADVHKVQELLRRVQPKVAHWESEVVRLGPLAAAGDTA